MCTRVILHARGRLCRDISLTWGTKKDQKGLEVLGIWNEKAKAFSDQKRLEALEVGRGWCGREEESTLLKKVEFEGLYN